MNKCLVLPDKPSIAPNTSRNDEHLTSTLNTILIRWSLVLNFLTYRSALHAYNLKGSRAVMVWLLYFFYRTVVINYKEIGI